MTRRHQTALPPSLSIPRLVSFMLVLSTAAGVQAQDAAPSEPAPAPTTAPAPTPEPAAPAPAAEPEEPPLPRPVAVATPAVEGEAQALPRPVETEPTEEAKAVAVAGGPTYPSLTIAIGARRSVRAVRLFMDDSDGFGVERQAFTGAAAG
jgi:hypothetical protein